MAIIKMAWPKSTTKKLITNKEKKKERPQTRQKIIDIIYIFIPTNNINTQQQMKKKTKTKKLGNPFKLQNMTSSTPSKIKQNKDKPGAPTTTKNTNVTI